MLKNALKILKISTQAHSERGVITMAETLIVLGIAAAVAIIWITAKVTQMEAEAAALAGRSIAAYSRAAAEWLAEQPPAADGDFAIAALQDCADPNGARFLPCNFSADTPIPHVLDAGGDPATFGDLVIAVDVTPNGVNGDIDFGVFRGGDDENADGLPDSRPDLAAVAFRAASEETGAGVFEFFRLQFARADLTGLVTDPDDAAFDQDSWDDLSRLQAQVGAQVDAPFLRVDGANEMNAGLTFNNGMQLNMQADGLEFQGAGQVGVQTLTADTLETTTLTADASTTQSITVNPVAGVRGAGFDRLDQSADITRIDGELADHDTRITANLNSITVNTADIAANRSNIDNNRNNITANRNNIAANRARLSAAEGVNSAQNTRLSRHDSRIGALERRPINPPLRVCTSTHTQLHSQMAALGWSQDIIEFECKECSITTTTRPYKERDPDTLACVTKNHKFSKFVGSCPNPRCDRQF